MRLQYQSRVLFTAVDREQAAARRLETEREALDVQKRAQAAALRVDGTARARLQMREATPSITQYVMEKKGVVIVSGAAVATRAEAAEGAQPTAGGRRQP